MAREERAGKNARKKSRRKPLKYFYLDGKLVEDGPTIPLLHKKLHINRSADIITTWCYPMHKRVAYTYSSVLAKKKPAFTGREVYVMLNRSRVSVENAIIRGDIEPPQKTYGIDEHKRGYAYYWSEKDVLAAHAYFSTVHRGRPRKDGLINASGLPTARELRAMMHDENILYVKQGDTFLPTWRAEHF